MDNDMNNNMDNHMEQDAVLLAEAAEYFRSRPGLNRLMENLIEKYRSLGRLGGTIILNRMSDQEQSDIGAFFRRRLPGSNMLVKAGEFEHALAGTRFASLDPLAVLTAWRGAPLVTREEERREWRAQRAALLEQLRKQHPHPHCRTWLRGITAGTPGTKRVRTILSHGVMQPMHVALRAIANLPEDYQRLPVFAREICGDPHGLDLSTETGKLFMDALKYIRDQHTLYEEGGTSDDNETVSAAESVSELLYQFHLLRDDLLNFVTCLGLAAFVGDREISYWRDAARYNAPLNMPLREIAQVTALLPVCGDTAGNAPYKVFLVENSGVFSALLDIKPDSQNTPPLICLHGQPKMASWALLDRLVQSGAHLYYSGDFDPEGLQIADKILRRYPGHAEAWRMDPDSYHAAKPVTVIERVRLKKLDSIQSAELQLTIQAIQDSGLVAYQEGLLEAMAADLWGGV